MICIDTRLSETSEEYFKKLWGGTAYFNSLCSNSRGIAVLIKDGVDISEAKFTSIIEGNFAKFEFVHKNEPHLFP